MLDKDAKVLLAVPQAPGPTSVRARLLATGIVVPVQENEEGEVEKTREVVGNRPCSVANAEESGPAGAAAITAAGVTAAASPTRGDKEEAKKKATGLFRRFRLVFRLCFMECQRVLG